MADEHKHDYYEFSRFFPLGDLANDPDWLSPDGGHDPGFEDGALLPASHPKLAGKVAEAKPYIALQCRDADCRHVVHIELNAAEWKKIQEAYELGALDPDSNGTHRFLSQMSLDDLGLTRVADKLSDETRRLSGAVVTIEDEGARFVSGDDSPVNARARETMLRSLGETKGSE